MGLWDLRLEYCVGHTSHMDLSTTYYSTITLSLSSGGILLTLPNNLPWDSLLEAEYYNLPSPYLAALIIVHVSLCTVKF